MSRNDWIPKLKQLHDRLQEQGISAELYRLHGLFGSIDEDEKLSLEIKKGKYTIEYEVYYKERGEKRSILTFYDIDEACTYVFDQLIDYKRRLHKQINGASDS
jgi:hypothetical protein